jgi:hypothetical protein
MKEILKRGATSNILRVFLQDSTSTTGAGKTGLSSGSAGLNIATIADNETSATAYSGANVEAVGTLGVYSAPTSGKCRFSELSSTNFPGVYEIQIADARFNVTNSTQLLICIQATGVAPVFVEYQLVAVDLMDTVRLGLTALPNVAQGSAGALITSGTGTAQLSVASGQVTVGTNNDKGNYSLSASQTFSTTGAVGSVTNNVGGNVSGSVNSVASAVTVGTINNDVITAASIAADAITAAKIADSAITIRLSTDATASEGRLVSGTVAGDVWNALLATYTGSTTFGGRIVRTLSTSFTNEVTIGSSNHIAANVHAFQNNVITNSAFASNAIDANVLAVDAANEIADALLNRNVAGGSSTGRLVKEALYALRNKTSISSSTLQVWNNDDTSIVWSATLSSDAAAIPITGIDPA